MYGYYVCSVNTTNVFINHLLNTYLNVELECGVTQTCQNGGVWNTGSCTCVCPKKFFGLNCERVYIITFL